MGGKSPDLADAVIDCEIDSELVPSNLNREASPARRRPRANHNPGFVVVPVLVRDGLKGASANARSLAFCLLELHHSTRKKGKPLK
jgi:hypothetical protein